MNTCDKESALEKIGKGSGWELNIVYKGNHENLVYLLCGYNKETYFYRHLFIN